MNIGAEWKREGTCQISDSTAESKGFGRTNEIAATMKWHSGDANPRGEDAGGSGLADVLQQTESLQWTQPRRQQARAAEILPIVTPRTGAANSAYHAKTSERTVALIRFIDTRASGQRQGSRTRKNVKFLFFNCFLFLFCRLDLLDVLGGIFFEILQATLAAELNLPSVLFKDVRFAHLAIELFV